MAKMLTAVWIMLLAAAVGCGNSSGPSALSGLAGMYRTTAHTQSRPCGATGDPLSIDPAYF